MHLTITLVLASASIATAAVLPRGEVTLAVGPNCGSFGGSPKDVNGNLPALSTFSTIVTFGDSYTDGGKHDGSPLNPPILHAPNTSAGGRYTNGPVWAEYLAGVHGAAIRDYAVKGAVVDVNQWPQSKSSLQGADDLLIQANTFISQDGASDPASTLYVLFFGIEDYVQSSENGNSSLSNQAQNIAYTMLRLASSPVFGKNFLIVDNHGRGTETDAGAAFKSELFTDLGAMVANFALNIGFVDLSTVWDGVLGSSPGAAAFGYTSTEPCLKSPTTTDGSCADPDHAFYWFDGNPTTVTHKIISDYVQTVMSKCTLNGA
ncbi:Thermolabile hemolysin [Leucoagaricus sp. SymC.cos]|nr:Thermolabile hemolysin [Leucoagaricus sp. SymC.cos]